jgi:hypothetical protein
MSSRNAVALWTLLSAAVAGAEEARVTAPPLPPVEPPAAKNVLWIEPVAGALGRAGISYERALGRAVSLSFEVLGGYEGAAINDVTFNSSFGYDMGAGFLGVGFRAFPLGEAPFGPWVGAVAHVGFGGQSLEAKDANGGTASHAETAFFGRGELIAGYSLLLYKGLSVQGSFGVGARYVRYLSGMAGEAISAGISTTLGVGYAF